MTGTTCVVGGTEDDGVLVNDTDAETDPLTAVLCWLSARRIATAFNLSSRRHIYLHPRRWGGHGDSFTYRAHDASDSSGVTTVTPHRSHRSMMLRLVWQMRTRCLEGGTLTANDDDATGSVGGTEDDGVLVNDTDAETDPLTAVLVGRADERDTGFNLSSRRHVYLYPRRQRDHRGQLYLPCPRRQ